MNLRLRSLADRLAGEPLLFPRCSVFGVCSGCRHQDKSTEAQLHAKQSILLENLAEADLSFLEFLPPLRAQDYHYRHRARLSIRYVPKKGGVLVGFREKNKRYVTDMEACPILPEEASNLIRPLRDLFSTLACAGSLPQVDVLWSDGDHALLLRHLVPISPEDQKKLMAFEEHHAVRFFLQPGGLHSIHPLRADPPIRLFFNLIDSLRLFFGPHHFTQIHPAVNRLMLQTIGDWLGEGKELALADLFCGVGNFSMVFASRGWKVTGLDAEISQIQQAKENAEINRVDHRATFRQADLTQPAVCAALPWSNWEAAILDPPRTGALDVVQALPAAGYPEKIVYVSCGPESFLRDLQILVHQKHYRPLKIRIADMFPHTEHWETLAFLQR